MSKVLMETDKGQLSIDLFDNDAPKTVATFLKLVKDGFYNGLSFHRVINGFMAQGGCPNTREGSRGMPGTGGLDIQSIVKLIQTNMKLVLFLWPTQERILAVANSF